MNKILRRGDPKIGNGPSAAARTDFGSCRFGNYTFGKLPLGKIPLGSCHLRKILCESTQHRNIDSPINLLTVLFSLKWSILRLI